MQQQGSQCLEIIQAICAVGLEKEVEDQEDEGDHEPCSRTLVIARSKQRVMKIKFKMYMKSPK
jgi:hypothetical protein